MDIWSLKPMALTLKVEHLKGNAKQLERALKSKTPAVYVGIPAATAEQRAAEILSMAANASGRQRKRLRRMATQDVNNAELLFIFSKGSPVRNQPPRPVLEPAVEFPANRKIITRELAGMMKAHLKGDKQQESSFAHRAAMAGQNAARDWLTNPENHWAPNAPSTIRQKGSDRPGIDTGAMRAAIVGIVKEAE